MHIALAYQKPLKGKRSCFPFLVYFLCASLSLLPSRGYGQTISGSIKDEKGVPVLTANILLKESDTGSSILAFAVTRNGSFKLQLQKSYPTIFLKVVSNGYKEEWRIIQQPQKDRHYEFTIILAKEITRNLDPVVVMAPRKPYVIQGDTVKYNIEAYKDGSERKVEDIIKKLPGISINEQTGEIKYNGRPIATVLVEGENLFDKNYTIGTKNINVDAIDQVQAIQNYFENPLLKGISGDDGVAINLKFKKGKTDIAASVDVSAGLFNDGKAAVNSNANLVAINEKIKSFGVLAFNNTGQNNSPNNYFSSQQSLEQISERKFLAERIISESRASIGIQTPLSNINQQFFSTFISSFKIGKKITARTSYSFLKDRITSERFSGFDYLLNNAPLSVTDNFITRKSPLWHGLGMEIKYMASPATLIEAALKYNHEEIKTPASILSNKNRTSQSFLQSKDRFLQGKLQSTSRLSANHVIQFTGIYSGNWLPQSYDITPAFIASDSIASDSQTVNSRKYSLDANVSLLGTARQEKLKYQLTAGEAFGKSLLGSGLYRKQDGHLLKPDSFVNDIAYTVMEYYQSGSLQLNYGKWKITPAYKLRMISQNLDGNTQSAKNEKGNTVLDPSISIIYRVGSTSRILTKLSYTREPNSSRYMYDNPIRTDNRTIVSNDANMSLQQSLQYNSLYLINDLYNHLELQLGAGYQDTKGAFFEEFFVTPNIIRINYFYLPQSSTTLQVNAMVSKYFVPLQGNIKLSAYYNQQRYRNVVNNSATRLNTTDYLTVSFFVKSAYKSPFNFENDLIVTYNKSKSKADGNFDNTMLTDECKLIVKPSKNLTIILHNNSIWTDLSNKTNYHFLDASCRFKLPKAKLEIGLQAKNLLNEQQFSIVETSDYFKSYFGTNLLSRHLMVNFVYSF